MTSLMRRHRDVTDETSLLPHFDVAVEAGGHHKALGGLAEGDVADGVEVPHGRGLVEADWGGAVLSGVLPVPGGKRLLRLDLLGHLAALQQLRPATGLGACCV